MKLARWSFHTYRLPYARPVRWSDIVEDSALFVLLRLESDDGAIGVGESTVKTTWGGVSPRSLIAALEDMLLPLLKSADLSDPAQARRRLDPVPENGAAKALLDNALWDLAAAKRSEPLWKTWGGRARVDLSWAVTRQAPGAMAKEAVAMVDRHGFRTLKVKGGQGVDTDVTGMREIRAAVGDGVSLYVDANSYYSRDAGPDYAKRMADAGAVAVEDPCALFPDDRFSALQAACPVPVLVDFNCPSPEHTRLFIERGARAISLKPGRVGLSDGRMMSELANKAGCRTVVGLFGESLLGTLSSLQLAATLPAIALASEVTWYLEMTQQVFGADVAIRDGAVTLPDTPSLAARVDWDAVARHAA